MSDAVLFIIEPTYKLAIKERREFERILAQYSHFLPGDADALTRLAVLYSRYRSAERETKRKPMVDVPIVNRSTGNVTGHKQTRNPAFATLRETSVQIARLERNLLIGPAYDAKRQAMLTKRARAAQGAEQAAAEESAIEIAITPAVIAAEIEDIQSIHGPDYFEPGQAERIALDHLRIVYPLLVEDIPGAARFYREDLEWLPDVYLNAIGAVPLTPEDIQRRANRIELTPAQLQ